MQKPFFVVEEAVWVADREHAQHAGSVWQGGCHCPGEDCAPVMPHHSSPFHFQRVQNACSVCLCLPTLVLSKTESKQLPAKMRLPGSWTTGATTPYIWCHEWIWRRNDRERWILGSKVGYAGAHTCNICHQRLDSISVWLLRLVCSTIPSQIRAMALYPAFSRAGICAHTYQCYYLATGSSVAAARQQIDQKLRCTMHERSTHTWCFHSVLSFGKP